LPPMSCTRIAPVLGAWLAICLVACGGDSTAPLNDPRGIMLGTSGTGSASEIFMMRPDGTDRRQLTHNTILDNDPDWSPDGSKIVYISAVDSLPGATARRRDVFVMNVDGSGSHRLFRAVDGPGAAHPRWSPDGTRISFDSFLPSLGFQPFVMNADGSNVKLVRAMPGENFSLEWSPDGTRFLFLTNRAPRLVWTLYLMPVDGSSEQQISGNGACTSNLGRTAQWSPDGSSIAYSCDTNLGSWISSLHSDGTVTSVTVPATVDFAPVWSPSGEQIAFASDRSGLGGNPIPQVYLINAGGGAVSQVTSHPVRQVVNAWRVH
jgi:Tol biopolymer transport system component